MPMPICEKLPLRMLARWPALCIQPLTIEAGVASEPEPQAMFSPALQLPLGAQPAALMRSIIVPPPGETWSKKRRLTMSAA